jgi:hypothetical protein
MAGMLKFLVRWSNKYILITLPQNQTAKQNSRWAIVFFEWGNNVAFLCKSLSLIINPIAILVAFAVIGGHKKILHRFFTSHISVCLSSLTPRAYG